MHQRKNSLGYVNSLADHVTVIWLSFWSQQQSDCRRVRYRLHSTILRTITTQESKIILLVIMSVTAGFLRVLKFFVCQMTDGHWFSLEFCQIAAKLFYSSWGCCQELLISGWTMYVEYFILLDKLCIHTKRMSKLYYKTLDFIKLENL